MPGDIIVADEDGAVVLPVAMADAVIAKAAEHPEWEAFSRMKLLQDAAVQRYYPLHADAWPDYEAWRKDNPDADQKCSGRPG